MPELCFAIAAKLQFNPNLINRGFAKPNYLNESRFYHDFLLLFCQQMMGINTY